MWNNTYNSSLTSASLEDSAILDDNAPLSKIHGIVACIFISIIFLVILQWMICPSHGSHVHDPRHQQSNEIPSDEKADKAIFDLRYTRIEASLVNKYVEKHDSHCDNIITCQNITHILSNIDVDMADQNTNETDLSKVPVVNPKIEIIEDDHATCASDNSMNALDCSICLEPFVVNDIVSWTSSRKTCRHVFHHSCIKEWLLKHDTCPDCRQRIVRHKRDLSCTNGEEIESMNSNCYYCHDHGVIHVQPTCLSDHKYSPILERCRRIPTVEAIISSRRYPSINRKNDESVSIFVVLNENDSHEPISTIQE